MKAVIALAVSSVVFGGLALAMAAQCDVPQTHPPPDVDEYLADLQFQEAAGITAEVQAAMASDRALQEAAKAYDYKGTAATASSRLAGNPHVEEICELFARADFVPEQRIRRYSSLDPILIVVGWGVVIRSIELRPGVTIVQVVTGPRLKKRGAAAIGVMPSYGELYRIVDGELQLIGCDPAEPMQEMPMCFM